MSLKTTFGSNWIPLSGIALTLISVGAYQARFESLAAEVGQMQSVKSDVQANQIRINNQADLNVKIDRTLDLLAAKMDAMGNDVAWIKGRMDKSEGAGK